jgi:hypothetical protein
LIVLAKHEAEEGGPRFLLVSLSNPDQVHPDLEHPRAVARQLGVPDLFYPDRRIRALAAQEDIELLCLAEPFADYAVQQGIFLHGFPNAQMGQGHWNASAHQLAGHLMSARVCAMLMASDPVISKPPLVGFSLFRPASADYYFMAKGMFSFAKGGTHRVGKMNGRSYIREREHFLWIGN